LLVTAARNCSAALIGRYASLRSVVSTFKLSVWAKTARAIEGKPYHEWLICAAVLNPLVIGIRIADFEEKLEK
jgi:hypothetical protein